MGLYYMGVRFWVGMWCTLLLFIIVMFDLSYSVRPLPPI